MYGWYYDPTFILVFAGLILTLIASAGVKSTFSRYSRVRCMAGYTGAQAAQEVLRISGIYDVRIERVAGELTDHYDPRAFVIVSETKEVYGEGFLNDPRERSAGEQARS